MILLSGGFDPLHVGHLRMIQEAATTDYVIVALNSDGWLMRKKGFVFMPWEERKELLLSTRGVSNVVPVDDSDGTVCKAIEWLKPDYFGNGGDRGKDNTPEAEICKKIGVKLVYNLGGGKVQSSSDMVKNAIKQMNTEQRKWGEFQVLYQSPTCKVKRLVLNPHSETSKQYHEHRNEHWVFPQDDSYQYVKMGEIHQLKNETDSPLEIIEVQTGEYFEESDIIRL